MFDVVATVDVAFRSATPTFGNYCPVERTNVNCDGITNVFDVVAIVDVAFRGGDPLNSYCDPCGF